MRFKKEGADHTNVQLAHYNFDQHGEEGEAYRQALASPQKWQFILEKYKSSKSMA